MPSHHCKHPTCGKIIEDRGYCETHKTLGQTPERAAQHAAYDQTRRDRTAKSFYDSAAWRATRLNKLNEQPWCEHCEIEPATDVHHDEPLRQAWDKRLDLSNLVSLCGDCHKREEAGRRAKNGKNGLPK